MNVLRWIVVLALLCLAFAALGTGKVLAWLGDKTESVAEAVTLWAAVVTP